MLQVNKSYGVGHSKKYRPSIISPVCMDCDEKGNVVHVHSDSYLLLRQRKLSERLGADAIRSYLDSIRVAALPQVPNLTDEELFSAIIPKEINNLTDGYQYAKYLKDNGDEVQKRYKNLVAQYKERFDVKKKEETKEEIKTD